MYELILAGDKVAIVGETGSGKTTLVNIISGLYKNYTDHAFLDGTELREINDELIREKIGIVSQDAILFSVPELLTAFIPLIDSLTLPVSSAILLLTFI